MEILWYFPVVLLFPGTFAAVERKVQELSLHGTFAPVEVELLLLRSFCSPKHSLPYFKNGGKHYSNLSIGVFLVIVVRALRRSLVQLANNAIHS